MKLHYIAIAIFLTACSAQPVTQLPSGYGIAQKGKFRLKNTFQLSDQKILSAEQVYVNSCDPNNYLTFYTNGRVAKNDLLELRDREDQPIFIPQNVAGYYSLTNNNITIEMTRGQSLGLTGDVWYDEVLKGSIAGDTLYFESRKHKKERCCYIKSALPYKKVIPDW